MLTTDVLVIGSGISGLSYAIKVAQKLPETRITIVTKANGEESNTKYAQGGVAVVTDFENDSSIDALTGTILTRISLIKKTKNKFLKFIRENEYMEYCQSFLAGRAVESQGNRLFTMSGAFSAFRRNKLLGTDLYNIETIGEDIDMTFQIRYQLKGRALLCPLALNFVFAYK